MPPLSLCDNNTNVTSFCNDTCIDENADEFHFHFDPCHTAVVTNIIKTRITFDEEIIIEGHGFSDVASDNQVTFGGWPCNVTSVNQSVITCLVDHQMEVGVLIPQPIKVNVYNSGEALIKIHQPSQRAVTFLPSVDSVTPSEGSVAGGTRLTIKGKGFGEEDDRAFVSLDGNNCEIDELSYEEIICITGESQEMAVTVTVVVAVVDYDMLGTAFIVQEDAMCVENCSYIFTLAATPEVLSVEPTIATTNVVQLHLTGYLFQNNATVTVGETPCFIDEFDTNYINCSTGNLRVGSNDVKVHVSGLGDAVSDGVTITVTPALDDISPKEGSVEGGTEITISGIGFNDDSTSVSIASETCEVIDVTSTQIICLTPASSAGELDADVLVVSNSISYPSAYFNYSTSYTPTVTDVSPDTAVEGDTVTITGTLFGSDTNNVMVTVGEGEFVVTSASPTTLTCIVGTHAAGTFDVRVHVDNLGIASASDVDFSYDFSVSSISPDTGRWTKQY